MNAAVASSHAVPSRNRFSRRTPCPICGGGHDLPQGRGIRCTGYRSGDGRWAYCSREEYAGPLAPNGPLDTYRHILDGDCRCGTSHGSASLPIRIVATPALRPAAPPPIDRALRDRYLRLLFAELGLTDAHRAYLRDVRGLTESEIAAHPFASLPQDARQRRAIAELVADELGDSAYGQCPGLYRDPGGPMLAGYAGLLIATVGIDGYWVGARVHPDAHVRARAAGIPLPAGDDTPKYAWLSSSNHLDEGGCTSGSPLGLILPPGQTLADVNALVAVEGELKSLVAAHRDGLACIVLPGATVVADVVPTLKAAGVPVLRTAYDRDDPPKPQVVAAEQRLVNEAVAADLAVSRVTWDGSHKGLDDAILAGADIRIQRPHPMMLAVDPAEVSAVKERARRAEMRNAAILRAITAPNLGPEKITYVAIANAVGAAGGELIPLTKKELAAEIGAGENTVKNHLKAIRDGAWPLADLVEVVEARVPERVNQTTGEVYGGYKCLHFRRADGVTDLDLLDAIAVAPPPPKGPKNGVGRYLRCPDCGHDQFVKTVTYTCVCCDKVMRQETSTVRLPDIHAGDDVPDTAPGEAAHNNAGLDRVGSNIDPYVTDSEEGWISERVDDDPPPDLFRVGSMFDPPPDDTIEAGNPFTDPLLVVRPADPNAQRRSAEDRRYREANRLLGTCDARGIVLYARSGRLWYAGRMNEHMRSQISEVEFELVQLVQLLGDREPPEGAKAF